jgi:hypothetical protein
MYGPMTEKYTQMLKLDKEKWTYIITNVLEINAIYRMYYSLGCWELHNHFSSGSCFSFGLRSKTTKYLYGTLSRIWLLLLRLFSHVLIVKYVRQSKMNDPKRALYLGSSPLHRLTKSKSVSVPFAEIL